jgi:hypothetical protein
MIILYWTILRGHTIRKWRKLEADNMPDKQQLHHLIDLLPESEISAAARYIEFFLAHEAPVDADLLARIDRARDQPSQGISHSDVLREFGL